MDGMESIVRKIPFFKNLSPSQVRAILHVGQITSYSQDEIICRKGEKSNFLFILMSGELAVKDQDQELARIKSVDVVGEMGVVTGEPRCATLQAAQDAAVMLVRKIDLDRLLKNDPELASKIYRNMIDSLCRKLKENNISLINMQTHLGAS